MRKKSVTQYQVGDFPPVVLHVFRAMDSLFDAEDAIKPRNGRLIPEVTDKVTPEKRQKLGREMLHYEIHLQLLLKDVLRAHKIPADKGFYRLLRLRRQILATDQSYFGEILQKSTPSTP